MVNIEAHYHTGKTLSQIALNNGIAQADLPVFILAVRTKAINAALADDVITLARGDKMLCLAARGMGSGV